MHLPPLPAADQRRRHVRQLHRREAMVLLPDGRRQHAPLIPRPTHGRRIRRPGHHARLLSGQFNARLLPQAQGLGVGTKRLDAHSPPRVKEEDIAGVCYGVRHRLQPVGLPRLPIQPALRLGTFIIGIPPRVQNFCLRGEDALLQRRRRRHQLKGRSRRIQPLDRPVHQRMPLVLGQRPILFGKCLRVIPRQTGHGQHPAVLHVQGHHGPAARVRVSVQKCLQGILRRRLQVLVQRQRHVLPRHRFRVPAASRSLHIPPPRRPMQRFLKGRLGPVLSHGFLHRIPLAFQFLPLLRAHRPHASQHMGGQRPASHALHRRGEGHAL